MSSLGVFDSLLKGKWDMFKKLMIMYFVFTCVTFTTYSNADTTKGDTSMNVIITFEVKEEKLSSFMEIMNDVKKNLPEVEGCNNVTVYNDTENSHIFTLVESWNSKDSHKKHIDAVVASGAWDSISQHLQGDPVSSYFKVH